jgi:RNA polymerase sigma factor (TIGR02999 family)
VSKSIEPNRPAGSDFDKESGELIVALYDQLRSIARREHSRVGGPQTLQPTALINEAYLKLRDRDDWNSQQHFLACAATAMRHILIDAARARVTSKRDAVLYHFTESLDSPASAIPNDAAMLKLGDALKSLSVLEPKLAQLVDCRFFAGLDENETAEILGVSVRTARRWWAQARALIHHEMATA